MYRKEPLRSKYLPGTAGTCVNRKNLVKLINNLTKLSQIYVKNANVYLTVKMSGCVKSSKDVDE